MLFRIEDLKYEEGSRCTYRASAAKVKKRLDEYGISFDFCRRVYEDLAANPLPSLAPYEDDGCVFDPSTPFQVYCKQLVEVWRTHGSIFELSVSQREEDRSAQQVVGTAFRSKDDENLGLFSEVETLIFTRTLLQEIPPKTILELDITELTFDYELGREWAEQLMTKWRQYLTKKVAVEYQLYGFVLTKDPLMRERLRVRVASMDEDTLLDRVLIPLLNRSGYERVQRVRFHGAGEFGRDIMPFRYKTGLGSYEYCALQAKATGIHGTSKNSGNIAELISQAMAAFSVQFMDDLDNELKRIDRFVIACNQDITSDARRIIEGALESKRHLQFLDLSKIIDLACEKELAAYILFGEECGPPTAEKSTTGSCNATAPKPR
ncbi:MAG: hypothetical protein WC708_20445 [Lentisphaeria bacterium]